MKEKPLSISTERRVHGKASYKRETITRNRFVTAGAERAALGMVVRLTVGLALVVEERAALELLSAILQQNAHILGISDGNRLLLLYYLAMRDIIIMPQRISSDKRAWWCQCI